MKAEWQDQVGDYLRKTLGLEVTFYPHHEAGHFPVVLEQTYEIRELEMQGSRFLGLRAKGAVPPPATLEKHADWFLNKTQQRAVFIFDRLNAYDRKRLIQSRVPFVVPGNQLYLPDLGLDLREQLRAPKRRAEENLTPAAQVVVLAAVLGRIGINAEMTGAGLAEQIGYTKMTMTRALGELRQHAWVEVKGERRFARNRFVLGRRELWEKTRPFLRTPVAKRIYLDGGGTDAEYLAGESALAERSMLAPGKRTTWAMTKEQWMTFEQKHPQIVVPEESKQAANKEIEIWRYDPRLLADPPWVDPLSLALSLENVQDERVQMAIDQLLEGIRW